MKYYASPLEFHQINKNYFALEQSYFGSENKSFTEILQCCICFNVANQNMTCPNCQTTVCIKCFESFQKCPHKCNSVLKTASVINSLTKNLKVKCWNEKCNEIFIFGNAMQHKLKCQFERIGCKNETCKWFNEANCYKNHAKWCVNKKIKCKYCEIEMKKFELTKHNHFCVMKKVKCPISELCRKKIRKVDLDDHKYSCKYNFKICKKCDCKYRLYRVTKKENKHSCIRYLKRQLIELKAKLNLMEERLDNKLKSQTSEIK